MADDDFYGPDGEVSLVPLFRILEENSISFGNDCTYTPGNGDPPQELRGVLEQSEAQRIEAVDEFGGYIHTDQVFRFRRSVIGLGDFHRGSGSSDATYGRITTAGKTYAVIAVVSSASFTYAHLSVEV